MQFTIGRVDFFAVNYIEKNDFEKFYSQITIYVNKFKLKELSYSYSAIPGSHNSSFVSKNASSSTPEAVLAHHRKTMKLLHENCCIFVNFPKISLKLGIYILDITYIFQNITKLKNRFFSKFYCPLRNILKIFHKEY